MTVSRQQAALLDELLMLFDEPRPPTWDDEHDRLELYRRCLAMESADQVLREALRLDTDAYVVSDVVAAALERRDLSEFDAWISVVPPSARAFVDRRAGEVALMRRHLEPSGESGWTQSDSARVLAASDWLQHRMAAASESRELLELLASGGRTRRVRAAAAHRLRTRVVES